MEQNTIEHYTREALLAGKEPVANAMIAWLAARGWKPDRVLLNTATKVYDPHQAEVWVEYDPTWKRFYSQAQYVSEGHNALASMFVYVPANASTSDIDALMSVWLTEVETAIDATYARRFCRREPQGERA